MAIDDIQKSLRDKLAQLRDSSREDHSVEEATGVKEASPSVQQPGSSTEDIPSTQETSQPAPQDTQNTPRKAHQKQNKNEDHDHDLTEADDHNPQIIYSWEAPVRAYKKRSTGVLRFYAAVAILLSLIFAFFREFVVIIPIWAIMFLFSVLTITKPQKTKHYITTFGIVVSKVSYPWQTLSHFYFIKKFDYDILVVMHENDFVHPLYLVLPTKKDKNTVLEILSDHLIYQENPTKTLTDRMAEWLTTLMPEEETTPKEDPQADSSKPEGGSPSRRTYEPKG